MPRQYPQQFRERALRMVEESLPEQKCEFAAMKQSRQCSGFLPKRSAGGNVKMKSIRVSVLVCLRRTMTRSGG